MRENNILSTIYYSLAYTIIYLAYTRFIRHVKECFLKLYINKMAAESCNSIVKTCNVSDIDGQFYVISGHTVKIFQRSLTWTRQMRVVHKTIPTVKIHYTLNTNTAVAMKKSRFRYLVAFQGVIERNVSCSPR